MWTLIPGVPIGCRSPRKRGPYSMPNDTSDRLRLGDGASKVPEVMLKLKVGQAYDCPLSPIGLRVYAKAFSTRNSDILLAKRSRMASAFPSTETGKWSKILENSNSAAT